ncbi:hypothetical protein NBRC116495_16530 [Aurantivibrio plasticivorans]
MSVGVHSDFVSLNQVSLAAMQGEEHLKAVKKVAMTNSGINRNLPNVDAREFGEVLNPPHIRQLLPLSANYPSTSQADRSPHSPTPTNMPTP